MFLILLGLLALVTLCVLIVFFANFISGKLAKVKDKVEDEIRDFNEKRRIEEENARIMNQYSA